MSKEILYSESGHIGTEEEDPMFELKIALYFKVGLFFGWNWQEFEATPYPVVKRLSEEIDFRLSNSDTILLNWNVLAMMQAVSHLFSSPNQE